MALIGIKALSENSTETFGANGIIMGPFQHGFMDLAQYSNRGMIMNFLKLAIKTYVSFFTTLSKYQIPKSLICVDCHWSAYVPNRPQWTELLKQNLNGGYIVKWNVLQ